jgi:Fe-S-cluster-containing dehydrogenase component
MGWRPGVVLNCLGDFDMKKWNMIVDVASCNNCYNCFVATKDEYGGNEFPGYSAPQPLHGHNWVDIQNSERGQWPMVDASFRPVMCNHCDDAPCMAAAEGDAITKRDDGIVIIDPEKSKGQKQLVDACPYGAIFWNDELDIPQAWPFDAHLLDSGWEKTKIEGACPTSVFKSIKLSDADMQELAEAEGLQTLEPRSGARPRVYYRNNHLFDSCFVGGTVIGHSEAHKEDCIEGALIIASREGAEIGRSSSDAFGEFRIDKLEPGSGQVQFQIESEGHQTLRVDVALGESQYLGCLTLQQA